MLKLYWEMHRSFIEWFILKGKFAMTYKLLAVFKPFYFKKLLAFTTDGIGLAI